MRAQEPGTETPAPNTGLNPPLNPNRLISDFDRSAALQLLLRERQPLHLARSYRCNGRGLCGDARDPVDVFHRRPAWHLLRSAGFAARTFCCPTCTSSGNSHRFARWAPRDRRSSRLGLRSPDRRCDCSTAPQTPGGIWCC